MLVYQRVQRHWLSKHLLISIIPLSILKEILEMWAMRKGIDLQNKMRPSLAKNNGKGMTISWHQRHHGRVLYAVSEISQSFP
jgi:hypothetical protein